MIHEHIYASVNDQEVKMGAEQSRSELNRVSMMVQTNAAPQHRAGVPPDVNHFFQTALFDAGAPQNFRADDWL